MVATLRSASILGYILLLASGHLRSLWFRHCFYGSSAQLRYVASGQWLRWTAYATATLIHYVHETNEIFRFHPGLPQATRENGVCHFPEPHGIFRNNSCGENLESLFKVCLVTHAAVCMVVRGTLEDIAYPDMRNNIPHHSLGYLHTARTA
jgi:hypothetical protein